MKSEKLSISADYVLLKECKVAREACINAMVLKTDSSLVGVRNLSCRDLDCTDIDNPPSMVEKMNCELSIGRKRPYCGEITWPDMRLCEHLRYLSSKRRYCNPQVPPMTKTTHPTNFCKLRVVVTTNPLEYFRCDWQTKSEDAVTFNHEPASIFYIKMKPKFNASLMSKR